MNRQRFMRCMDALPSLVSFWRASRARTSIPSLITICFFSIWLSVMALFAGGFIWGTPVQAAALSASLPVAAQTQSAPATTGPSSVPAPAYTSALSRWHVKKGTPADVRQVKAQNLVGNANQSKGASTTAQPNATFPMYYVPVGLGEHGDYTFGYKRNLTDRESIEVNAANGNLIFHASGLSIQGTGLNFSLDSFYNSQEIYDTEIGQNWTFSNATGIFLLYNGDGSIIFHSPTDTWNVFPPKSGGGFTSAPGLNATMVANSDNTHTLTFHKTGEVLSFDPNGFLTVDKDKNGNKLTFTYNSPGSIDTITDTQGRVTTITHNATGKATLITDPTGRTIKYTYDVNDLLTSMTDLNGKTTTFTYQGAPAGSDQVKADLATITDPAGHVTTIGYNDIDQVTSIKDASGATTTLAYTTGSNANTVLKDANGKSTTYAVSGNHVLSTTDALGHAQSATYDSQNNVIASTDALLNKNSFVFNATTNNLTAVTDSMGVNTGFAYSDTTHPYYPTSQTDTQGNQTAYTYTPAGNVATVKSGQGLSQTQTYAYNGNGTVSSSSDADGSTHTTTYSYDSKGNLTTITPKAPLGQQTLTYDGLSRATSLTDGNGKKTSYSYNVANELISSSLSGTTTSYSYDGNGNQTASSAGSSISYNVANQSTTMNGTANTYSGADQSQRVKSGTATAVYSQLGLASEATADGTTYYIRCSCSALVGERTPSGTYYYLFDGLGSIVGLTDSSGNLVNTYQYDPYGNLTSSTGMVSNPWRYAGGYSDSGTGLYKFGIRYYDPSTGRWTQRDPVGGSLAETVKANPYVYAANDPVTMVDPSGAFCIPHALLAVAGAFGILAAVSLATLAFIDPATVIAAIALTFGQAVTILATIDTIAGIIAGYFDAIASNSTWCF